ncbi:hypothetical protein C0J52_06436 [Blattella germanica]|nr:hypothetical protein C0J52_06436 [Blattella germanica]
MVVNVFSLGILLSGSHVLQPKIRSKADVSLDPLFVNNGPSSEIARYCPVSLVGKCFCPLIQADAKNFFSIVDISSGCAGDPVFLVLPFQQHEI